VAVIRYGGFGQANRLSHSAEQGLRGVRQPDRNCGAGLQLAVPACRRHSADRGARGVRFACSIGRGQANRLSHTERRYVWP